MYDTGKIAYYSQDTTGLRYAMQIYGNDDYIYNGINYQNYYINLYGNNVKYVSYSPSALATAIFAFASASLTSFSAFRAA